MKWRRGLKYLFSGFLFCHLAYNEFLRLSFRLLLFVREYFPSMDLFSNIGGRRKKKPAASTPPTSLPPYFQSPVTSPPPSQRQQGSSSKSGHASNASIFPTPLKISPSFYSSRSPDLISPTSTKDSWTSTGKYWSSVESQWPTLFSYPIANSSLRSLPSFNDDPIQVTPVTQWSTHEADRPSNADIEALFEQAAVNKKHYQGVDRNVY